LPCVARWIMSRTRKRERSRGHRSVSKHVMQRKFLLEVVNKCS
jgi:hypothetical protein